MIRRAGVLTVLVAMVALGGASVAPTRGLQGRHGASVVWQARDAQQAPVTRNIRRQPRGITTTASQPEALVIGNRSTPFVRHSMFQRPPPSSIA
jgi:hypothetical protein